MKISYLVAASAACICVATPAVARANTYRVDLPAQPLSKSLFEISKLTGLQVVFSEPQITERLGNALSGNFTPQEMLERLLRASGYSFAVNGNVVRVYRLDRPAVTKINAVSRRAPLAPEAPAAPAAPEAPREDTAGLQDIIVTAQKRETRLQDTPISIAVLGDEALENRHVVSLASLGEAVPGLRITPFSSRSSAIQVTIRGLGSPVDASQSAQDPAVGIYADGVYLGRAQGLGSALFDVERIEVLKGPQGTLFGRNTEGGAISIVTRKPTGEFGMRATAGLSNFNGHEASAHVDLPSFGNVSLKFDGVLNKRGGTVKNPLAGYPEFHAYDKRGLRVSALEAFLRFQRMVQLRHVL